MYGRERGVVVNPAQEAIASFYRALFQEPRLGDVLNLYEAAVRVISSTETDQRIASDRIHTLAYQGALVAARRENPVLFQYFGEEARRHQPKKTKEEKLNEMLKGVEGLG